MKQIVTLNLSLFESPLFMDTNQCEPREESLFYLLNTALRNRYERDSSGVILQDIGDKEAIGKLGAKTQGR